MRLLSHTTPLCAPLLPACCSSQAGFALTFIFCTIPCCTVPVAVNILSATLLPAHGLPADLLAPSLTRAAALTLPAVLFSMLLGPSGIPDQYSNAAHAAVLLMTVRIIWGIVVLGLLMPSLLTSHAV